MNLGDLPKNSVFKRFIVRDGGFVKVIELADYNEYQNAKPDIMPEAEIKVRDTDSLKAMLSNSESFRKTVSEVAAQASGGDLTEEDANKLLLALMSKDNQNAKKRGLIQRFLDLFKNDQQ